MNLQSYRVLLLSEINDIRIGVRGRMGVAQGLCG